MSYPTMENTRWERKPQTMVLAPRKSVILRADDDDLPRDQDGNEQKKEKEPLGEWHQVRRGHQGLATCTAWFVVSVHDW